MSRSSRKTPIIPVTTAVTDKPFKRAEHGRERVASRAALVRLEGDRCPHPKRYGDPWDGGKDGKVWLGGRDATRSGRLMRK